MKPFYRSSQRLYEYRKKHATTEYTEKSLCLKKEFPLKDLTEQIISCAIEVHKILGPGLFESVYEEALAYEFQLRRISFERQKEIELKYKGNEIGKHRIDFLVKYLVIVELKAVVSINKIHEAQILTYLKAMDKRIGLLLNFNEERLKTGIKRFIV